jgi:hypothetical protein
MSRAGLAKTRALAQVETLGIRQYREQNCAAERFFASRNVTIAFVQSVGAIAGSEYETLSMRREGIGDRIRFFTVHIDVEYC